MLTFRRTKPTVSLGKTAVGEVLVDADGRTVYLFTADNGEESACYGECATAWPPLIASEPTAGHGVEASKLGTTKREDGELQVTYGGYPLYYFIQDETPGDVNGQGIDHFGGEWWVVSAAGEKTTVEAMSVEFLVEFNVGVPDGTPTAEVEKRTRAEASAAAKLVDDGHLLRLWRRDATTTLGLYAAASEAELDRLLGALPLADWMEITVTPLVPHPNDPAAR